MRALLTCLVFAACTAKAGPPPTTVRTAHTKQTLESPPKPNTNGPSESECDALLTHALAIVVAARPQRPPDADQTAVRAELRPAFIADCRAGTREYHACGLAAKTATDFEACK